MYFHNISLSKDWSSLGMRGGGGGGDGTRKSYDVPIDLIQAISTWSTLLFTNTYSSNTSMLDAFDRPACHGMKTNMALA